MTDLLLELRHTLVAGIQLSKQGSYRRRSPSKASLPYLIEARDRLRRFLQDNPTSAEGWELLSRAEECLLHYDEAVACLRKSMLISGKRDRRDIKRLAHLRDSVSEWSTLSLTPQQLSELGAYLVEHGAEEDALGGSMAITNRWLLEKGFVNVEEIIQALRDHGGYSDFQVLHNVVK